jgi:phosphatidylserine decarboxylase
MVKEGIPFVLVPALFVVGFAVLSWWIPAAVFLFICAFMAYFFRDPERTIPTGPNIIVSAADGRVTRIDDTADGKLVSVFLSPLDVHINRSPIAGRITSIEYTKGKKLPATNNSASFVNERNSLLIESDDMTVKCTQIAGILARRIVCWPVTGDNLERGEKFGLIKFSSRTDLLMPADVTLEVKLGDRVKGGETIIARRTA